MTPEEEKALKDARDKVLALEAEVARLSSQPAPVTARQVEALREDFEKAKKELAELKAGSPGAAVPKRSSIFKERK